MMMMNSVINQQQQLQTRYDRQIRLWGDEGQLFIQQARICVFGSSALAAEILKSLVLAGIGSFHIIDDKLVDSCDFGQNFFVETDDLGKYRGQCLVRLLTELNPSVHGQHSSVSFTQFSHHDLQTLMQFSLVVGTNMYINEAMQLSQFLYENNIPFIFARVYGMIGHLRLSFREHIIWNNRSENSSHDLRLDDPFPELLKLANKTDLNSMTHEQHSHTPYVLLYFKAVDIWKQRHGNNLKLGEEMEGDTNTFFPEITDYMTRKEIDKILKEMRQPDDKGCLEEENFAEATRNLLKGMCRTKVTENVLNVLADPKIELLVSTGNNKPMLYSCSKENIDQFWILCAALREFIAKFRHMPVSGQLPDMTSDSKRYAQLLGIYRDKALEDAAQLHIFANQILNQHLSALSLHSLNDNTTFDADGSVCDSANETTDDEDDGELSRMSTSDANEQQRTSLSLESMEGDDRHQTHSQDDDNNTQSMAYTSNTPSLSNGGSVLLEKISMEQCQAFCKNATKIGIQYGTSLSSEFVLDIQSILQRIQSPRLDESPPYVDPLAWYVMLRATDRFQHAYGRLPTETTDLRDLQRCLTELFAETKNPELIAQQNKLFPLEILNEICRYGASEPHVMTAIFGGCVAQEIIKICTQQYVPVDNSLIYDGHSQQAATFRVGKRKQ